MPSSAYVQCRGAGSRLHASRRRFAGFGSPPSLSPSLRARTDVQPKAHRRHAGLDARPSAGATAAAALSAAALLLAAGTVLAMPAHASSFVPAAGSGELRIPGLIGDDQFTEGLVSAFLLILFSEIGDKTFFIALLLALKEDKAVVFGGTFGALAAMTVISVALGQVAHRVDELLPKVSFPLDDVFAVVLLVFFGVQTLRGAATADARASEEKEEAGEVVSGVQGSAAALALAASTFSLVFAAEWGDKSFLATIALAAASDPAGVVAGALGGHAVATGLAVAGGGLLSSYLSEQAAQYIGGSLFLVFAGATVYDVLAGGHV